MWAGFAGSGLIDEGFAGSAFADSGFKIVDFDFRVALIIDNNNNKMVLGFVQTFLNGQRAKQLVCRMRQRKLLRHLSILEQLVIAEVRHEFSEEKLLVRPYKLPQACLFLSSMEKGRQPSRVCGVYISIRG